MMQMPSDEQFAEITAQALNSLPGQHVKKIDNIAIVYTDEPSPQQRRELGLHCDQLLFGLYEGIPLPARGGRAPILPDKITIFKKPLVLVSSDLSDLRKRIRHTLWHEIAHYFGLDHARIHQLEEGR